MQKANKLSFFCLAFLAIFLSLEFVYAQDENLETKDQQTAAVAIVDNGVIYSEPTLNSQKISRFKFNDCFFVSQAIIKPIKGKADVWKWARVQTSKEKSQGWVPAESIRWLYPPRWKQSENIDWILVRFNIASGLYNEPQTAEKILNQLLKQNPKHKVSIYDEEACGEIKKTIIEAAPERIAQLYAGAKQYELAVQKYILLVNEQKKNPRKRAYYHFKLIDVLSKSEKMDSKIKEKWYWNIIIEEPSSAVNGDEWNAWVDEAAANALLKMKRSPKDTRGLGATGDKMMKIAENFRVYILGAEAKIESLMAENKFAAAKKILLQTYKKYPTGISTYFKSEINSTFLIFGAYLNGFNHRYTNHDLKLTAIRELEKMELDASIQNYIR